MAIKCVFAEHPQRADTCQKDACGFFRTQKGTLWPLCASCSERHRKLILAGLKAGGVTARKAAGATFDIPLDDPETLEAFQAQGSEILEDIIRSVGDGPQS